MLSWEYPPYNVGGLGKHVMELVPALAKQGVEVYLLTPRWVSALGEEPIVELHPIDYTEGKGVPTNLYRVASLSADMSDFFSGAMRVNLNLADRGRKLVEGEDKFDLLHAHDWLVAHAAFSLKHAYGLPLISTIHATEYGRSRGNLSGELQRAIHNVEWWLTYESWRVICCSRHMVDEVGRIFQTPLDKIDLIPNGVDPTRFDRLEGKDLRDFRAGYAMADEKIVLYVGRLVYEKGVHLLVESVPRVLDSFPWAKFVVVGTGDSMDSLRQRAMELGVDQKIYFTGFVSDEVRDRLFKVADVAVLPSLYEPFGIVALEAMAAKTPVVAAGVGGLAEVIVHNETGILVHPDNVDSLTWGILHTLLSPDWAAMRAQRAYEVVVRDYGWMEIARRTKEIYERVIRERQASPSA